MRESSIEDPLRAGDEEERELEFFNRHVSHKRVRCTYFLHKLIDCKENFRFLLHWNNINESLISDKKLTTSMAS